MMMRLLSCTRGFVIYTLYAPGLRAGAQGLTPAHRLTKCQARQCVTLQCAALTLSVAEFRLAGLHPNCIRIDHRLMPPAGGSQ